MIWCGSCSKPDFQLHFVNFKFESHPTDNIFKNLSSGMHDSNNTITKNSKFNSSKLTYKKRFWNLWKLYNCNYLRFLTGYTYRLHLPFATNFPSFTNQTLVAGTTVVDSVGHSTFQNRAKLILLKHRFTYKFTMTLRAT